MRDYLNNGIAIAVLSVSALVGFMVLYAVVWKGWREDILSRSKRLPETWPTWYRYTHSAIAGLIGTVGYFLLVLCTLPILGFGINSFILRLLHELGISASDDMKELIIIASIVGGVALWFVILRGFSAIWPRH